MKVGYDGARFHGSQVQPGVRTVHAALAEALRDMGHEDPRIAWAGRTDAGVSAAGNVAVFDTHLSAESLLPGISFRVEDAWAWAWAEVGEAFEPRHASRRRYRYFLRTSIDAAPLADALRLFEGTHDFTAFCKLEPDVNPHRTVFATRATREGPFVVIDVEGQSFLWNQVRRMVSAAERVADGRLARREIAEALAGARRADFGTADPEPLLLLDVEYDGVRFEPASSRVKDRLRASLSREETRLAVLRALEGGP